MVASFGRHVSTAILSILVHVGAFQQSVCESLSPQAAGSLKVGCRILQFNRSHLLCKLLLERTARRQQGITYARVAGSFMLKFSYCLPAHTAVSRGHMEKASLTNSCSRPPRVPLLARVRSRSRTNASFIFWILWLAATALSDNISMATSRRRAHSWSAGAPASYLSLKVFVSIAVRILAP